MSLFHRHRDKEYYGGFYADEPDGPKTIHEIWWECDCGSISRESLSAKNRARTRDKGKK